MKKKNLIVAIVMASMIMGGCGQKTVTSVSEDPTVSEAPMKEDTLEPEESAEDATQSAEESQEATDSSSTSSNATKESNKATESNTASGSSNTSGEGNTATDNSGSTNNNTASSAGKDTQTVSESTEDTQPTGVQTKYKMYDGVYFDEVIYTWSMDDSQVRPYCEINVSNATDTSFDFTIYDVDGQNRSQKFKTHTAVFTGDGTQAEYNGNGYHLVFTFPDDRGALPDVVCMQVSGLKDMGGCMYVNNTVPGHEFG